jgi:glycosyltransferase involved in cell wall biosynthesis
MKAGIVLVLSGFPRRSETFALHEVLALEERGDLAAIFATKPGDGLPPHPGSEALLKRVQYLPAGDAKAQAHDLVQRLDGQPVAGIHAYFAHTPAEVAEHAAAHLQVPYGFSVHARDARKVREDELVRRARAAACVVACNSDVAISFDAEGIALKLLPHGVDTQRFSPKPLLPVPPIRLLAAGRLVEKKGFDVLIQAAAQLTFPFRLRIVGDGEQRQQLMAAIEEAHLQRQVELCGSVTHAELPALYAEAHIVVVPSVVDQSGDRDGLPNVALEAMASGRPVVASDVGAVSSALVSEQSGLLVPPGDAAALADALERLARDLSFRSILAHHARIHVAAHFDLRACTDRFCRFLESTYGIAGPL